MAPTTRAGSERQVGGTVLQSGQQRKTSKTAPEAARKEQQHFPFLKLSPELRNRIYDYASEHLQPYQLAPRVACSPSSVKPHELRLWKFFALTQTCKLIRAEYCPLWMRACSVRLGIYSLPKFVETFLSNESQLKHPPRLLQIVWEHGSDSLGSTDISPLLLLRAHCPQFGCKFVPYNIAAGFTRGESICPHLQERFRLEDFGMDPEDNMWDDCSCASSDLDEDEWEDYEYGQMSYTYVIRNLVHTANNALLDAVRKGKVTVRCCFTKNCNRVTFRILYTEQVYDDTNNTKAAWELLNGWGLFGLPGWMKVDFVLAYESTQKSKEGNYDMEHSVVREVRFTKTETKRQR